MKKRNKLMLLLVAFLVIFTGCKNKNDQGSADGSGIPENVHQTFLLFKEDDNKDADTETGASVGSLYIKKEDEGIELIAKDVLDFTRYDNDTEEVLYLDQEATLYHFTDVNEKPTVIADDVYDMRFSETDDNNIIYITEEDGAYVYSDGTSEKVGSNVNFFEVIGDEVYYNTYEDKNFILYNIETREEKRIASNVMSFRLLDDGNQILYLSDDSSLYYLDDLDGDSLRISSNPVSLDEVVKIDDKIYFTEHQDNGNQLFLEDLGENSRPEVIADDVYEFKVDGETIYYLSSDSILYKLEDENRSTRIAVDIVGFELHADQLVFLDEEENLHSWETENEESTTVGHDVVAYDMFSNGDLYYLTEDKELFKENTKLASDVDYYSVFYDTLAYANNQSLYLIQGEDEQLILDDALDDYSVVYYQNYPVYENRLTLPDIRGFWKFTDDDEEHYFEIKSNDKMIIYDYEDEETLSLEVIYSGYNDLQVRAEEVGEYISFYYEDEQLMIEDNNETYPLTKTSLKEMDEYIENYEKRQEEKAKQEEKERQEAEAKEKERERQEAANQRLEEAHYTVEGFIRSLADAVNYGEFYMLSPYINPGSSFYDEQSDFVADLYDRGISEELYDYSIIDKTMNEDGSITINTREEFRIYNSETDKSSESSYQATYTLKEINGEYLIDQLKVN